MAVFAQGPADGLHGAAVHLALNQRRVDGFAAVDRGVQLGHLGDARLNVNFDLSDRGVVVESGDGLSPCMFSPGALLLGK